MKTTLRPLFNNKEVEMTQNNVPKMWLVYEDIFGRNIGPYVLRKAFKTQAEADEYMKKSNYPTKKGQHDYRSKLDLYPEYFNEL